jgi:hypothetical protein
LKRLCRFTLSWLPIVNIYMSCLPACPVANLTELYIVNSKFQNSVIFKYVSFVVSLLDGIYEYNVLNSYLYLGEIILTYY